MNWAEVKVRVKRRSLQVAIWLLKRGLLAAFLAAPFYTLALILSSTLWLLAVVPVYFTAWFANSRYLRRFDRRRQRRAEKATAELRQFDLELRGAREQLAERDSQVMKLRDQLRVAREQLEERNSEVLELRDQFKRENAEKTMKVWPTLAVKHDLNHLALPIRIRLETIRNKIGEEAVAKELERLVELMLHRVDDFATGFEMNHIRWKPRYDSHSLENLLRPVEAFARAITMANVAFEAKYDPVARVRTDGVAFGRIVQNLLVNALHRDAGAQRVALTLESDSPESILIRVEDDGEGHKLTDDQLGALGHPANVDRMKGKGLGILVCRELARGLGGSLSAIRSPQGKGLRLEVLLPRL